MNTVELQGKIAGISSNGHRAVVTLFIDGKNHQDYPSVIFTGKDQELVKDFKKEDYVNISGSVKTSLTRPDGADGKPVYHQFLKGEYISPVNNEMSEKFGKTLGGDYQYKNEVLIDGTIISSNIWHNTLNYIVRPSESKSCLIVCDYTMFKENKSAKYAPGTQVCLKCAVQTKRKKTAYGPRKFENIVVKYISIPAE